MKGRERVNFSKTIEAEDGGGEIPPPLRNSAMCAERERERARDRN